MHGPLAAAAYSKPLTPKSALFPNVAPLLEPFSSPHGACGTRHGTIQIGQVSVEIARRMNFA
jgi:hypothetical protein